MVALLEKWRVPRCGFYQCSSKETTWFGIQTNTAAAEVEQHNHQIKAVVQLINQSADELIAEIKISSESND